MPIEAWFPTLVLWEDLELPDDVQRRSVEAVKDAALAPPAQDLHLGGRLDALFERLSAPVRTLLVDVLQLDPQLTELHVGRCWPLPREHSAAAGEEEHVGALLTGLFFLEAPDGAGGVELIRPRRATHDLVHKRQLTQLTFSKATYAARRQRLVLFTSDVPFRVLPNAPQMPHPRIALGFDVYTRTAIEDRGGGMPKLAYLRPIGGATEPADSPSDPRPPRRLPRSAR